MKTPECDKVLAVNQTSQKIGEFLEWLPTQGLYLCEIQLPELYELYACADRFIPYHLGIEKLLAKFFDIDLDKVEKEKRADSRLAGLGMMGIDFLAYHAKKTKKKAIPKKLVAGILEFARVHQFTINPFGLSYWIENYQTFHHCVCDKDRPLCPCPEAPEEVSQKGRCLCKLYWKDLATFMKEQGWEVEKKREECEHPSLSSSS